MEYFRFEISPPRRTAGLRPWRRRSDGVQVTRWTWLILFFDGDIILYVLNTFNTLGDFASSALLIGSVDKSTELNRTSERGYVYIPELILRVVAQGAFDSHVQTFVIDVFAGAAVVAISGAPG